MVKQRVVILGSGGFVGGAILRQLDAQHYAPIPIARKECDFMSEQAIQQLGTLIQDGDVVVCAAAKAPAKNLDMLCENITLMHHVVEALRGKKLAYVLNISSDAVYADSDGPLSEASITAPLSAHGIMHCMREQLLERNLACTIGHLRPTLIFGEGDPHNGYGPNSFLRLAQKNENIALFGQGEERRDHIYVGDVAKLAVAMIGQQTQGAINAVTGTVTSFMDIAQMAVQATGGAITITSKPRSGPMPHNGYRPFDASAARRLCAGFPFVSLAAYMAQGVGQQHAV